MRRASDLMRRNVITLGPEETLGAAREIMQLGRIRQLPVVDKGHVVGELSWQDVCRAFGDVLAKAGRRSSQALRRVASRPVRDCMQAAGELTTEDTPLDRVAALIVRRGAGFVPVVDAPPPRPPRLLGIVTERDLLRLALEREARAEADAGPSGAKTG
jgi:CBS domain-containing protein